MNNNQILFISLVIFAAIISHGFITKPVPVVNNITIPEPIQTEIYPGRYQLSDGKLHYRFDTITGKMYESTGNLVSYKYSYWRPLRIPGEELSLEDIKFMHPEIDVKKWKEAREKRKNKK